MTIKELKAVRAQLDEIRKELPVEHDLMAAVDKHLDDAMFFLGAFILDEELRLIEP